MRLDILGIERRDEAERGIALVSGDRRPDHLWPAPLTLVRHSSAAAEQTKHNGHLVVTRMMNT